MTTTREFTTFQEMVGMFALNNPHGLICDWWRRLNRSMDYFVVAYHGKPCQTAFESVEVLARHSRIPPNVVLRLHKLRRFRNRIEHGPTATISAPEAEEYAWEMLELIGVITNAVPDSLAIESGAAGVV